MLNTGYGHRQTRLYSVFSYFEINESINFTCRGQRHGHPKANAEEDGQERRGKNGHQVERASRIQNMEGGRGGGRNTESLGGDRLMAPFSTRREGKDVTSRRLVFSLKSNARVESNVLVYPRVEVCSTNTQL